MVTTGSCPTCKRLLHVSAVSCPGCGRTTFSQQRQTGRSCVCPKCKGKPRWVLSYKHSNNGGYDYEWRGGHFEHCDTCAGRGRLHSFDVIDLRTGDIIESG